MSKGRAGRLLSPLLFQNLPACGGKEVLLCAKTTCAAAKQLDDIAEETGDEVILMKDQEGRLIGFEKLNFKTAESERVQVAFEGMAA